MKLKTKIASVAAAVVMAVGLGVAPPATAGNGTGYVINESWSVQCTKGSLDYQGAWGHYSVCPGQRIGGAGWDIDSVWIPPNRYVRVLHQCPGYYLYYNNRGRAGYWVKVNDCGARVLVQY